MDTTLQELATQIRDLRDDVHTRGDALLGAWSAHGLREAFLPGARNLADYLILRQHDLGPLQDRLAALGLSSLGRAESRIRTSLAALAATLERLTGGDGEWPDPEAFTAGLCTIASEQQRFFGAHAIPHATRIMVTLPSEAAEAPELVSALIEAGATCLRINCAHDDSDAWSRMIAHIRTVESRIGRHVPLLMDIAGAKLRVLDVHAPNKRLYRGDRMWLLRNPAALTGPLNAVTISHPDVLDRVAEGAAVLIDDGKIGARVVQVTPEGLLIEIVTARAKGVRLKPEKGVNLPSVELDMDPLTDKDRADLDFIAVHADAVGYSFVQRAHEIDALADALAVRRGDRPVQPLLLKIETPLAVRNLPRLLVAAGGRGPVAVMIARGDLAMEVGPERLSEVQEEILWLCEAAHVPVVWATQVLETLVKDGAPTRAEITDAAMGQRAECVMLNKGPFILDGVRFLAGILRRMDRHQFKKSARLSALTSWRDEQSL